ncbi:8117_t:CDS:2 [Funneliformis caledonium]|uniref:8117_t:CDS:1 n=1 Tax=Funneliformis caledonium TaxID=1117310 RepID=A0A9N9N9G9_9GLOM|nr:8117_t:CDS:2 [Funneliformis caledonium]
MKVLGKQNEFNINLEDNSEEQASPLKNVEYGWAGSSKSIESSKKILLLNGMIMEEVKADTIAEVEADVIAKVEADTIAEVEADMIIEEIIEKVEAG